MKNLFALFIVFSKIGGFTFGGGYAMLELMKTVKHVGVIGISLCIGAAILTRSKSARECINIRLTV